MEILAGSRFRADAPISEGCVTELDHINDSEQRRIALIKQHVSCLPCLLQNAPTLRNATIRHVCKDRKMLGHGYTYPVCEWHGAGIPPIGLSTAEATLFFGPSAAHDREDYLWRYGPELVLVDVASMAVNAHTKAPWIDYNIPVKVHAQLIGYWREHRGSKEKGGEGVVEI